MVKLCQPPEILRDLADQVGMGHPQVRQSRHVPELDRDALTGERIVSESEAFEHGKVTELGRERAIEEIAVKIEGVE